VVVKCSGLLLHLHFFFRFILKRIFGYALKCSVHIEAFFCGSLKVRYVSLSSAPCLRFLLRNLQLINWRQWGIFFPRGLHKRVYFAAQQHYEVTFYEIFSNMRKNTRVMKRKDHLTTRLLPPSTSILFPNTTNGKFSGSDGLACRLIPQNMIFRDCLWTMKNLSSQLANNHLNQKLFSPIIKILKWLHDIHIMHKNTTVCTTVESHSKTLKPLLSCSIPYLHI
jgi:hypothetical protein